MEKFTTSASPPKQKYLFYVMGLLFVAVVSLLSNHVQNSLTMTNNDKEMIQKFLLDGQGGGGCGAAGGSCCEGGGRGILGNNSKPKLWIHVEYEKNARKWESFQSRNTKKVNQPYISLTVETIINHCSNDFHICLVDDSSFLTLLPYEDDVDDNDELMKNYKMMQQIPEPRRSHIRDQGMLQLLYHYGGIIVPKSFICFSNLKDLFDKCIQRNKPFLAERANHDFSNASSSLHSTPIFKPSIFFMGCNKKNEMILEMMNVMDKLYSNSNGNYVDFLGSWDNWCSYKIHQENKIDLLDGQKIGVKTKKGKPITIEELFEDKYLNIIDDDEKSFYGIYIPSDEIMKRTKYQWFSVLPKEEMDKCNAIIAKYLIAAIVETNDEYLKLERKTTKKQKGTTTTTATVSSI